jgi:hypothetical protein
MPNPKTWDLLAAFETCLQRVRVANGFYTDAGAFVTREPAQISEEQGALLTLVIESVQRAEEPATARTHNLVTVVVIGKVATGVDDGQLRLHELIADVEAALHNRLDVFQPGIQYPRFVEARVIPPVEGMRWIGCEARFTAHVPKR